MRAGKFPNLVRWFSQIFPLETFIDWGFPIAMFDCRRLVVVLNAYVQFSVPNVR